MSLWSDLSERTRALLGRSRDRELDDELRFHLEREVEERIRRGADPAAARRGALLAFGGVEQIKEEVRDASGVRPLEDLLADIRYAVRTLRSNPAFAIAATLVLGLGLGAATAVFTVADRVLFAALPYPQAERLARIYHTRDGEVLWQHLSAVDALGIREQQRAFDALGFVRASEAAISGIGPPVPMAVGLATAGFFDALSVQPAVGRSIRPEDEAVDAPGVVIISDRFARERLGGPAAAIGRSITIDGEGHTVVGVLPAGVDQLAAIRAGIWAPLELPTPTRRGPFQLRGIGRLRPGATFDDAARDLVGVSDRLFPIWASSFRDQSAKLGAVPLRETIVRGARRQVELFAGAVALVLLVAIANVATLMLVRASARESELAVRSALGAGRSRLARLLITESLVLTAIAGVVGIGVAAFGVRLWISLAPYFPRAQEIGIGGRSVGFVALTSALSGLLVSAPAIVAGLVGRGGSLRLDTRRVGTGRRSNAVRAGLVVTEFALALPLLVAAGLLVQSLLRLQRVDPGFDPEGVVALTLTLPAARYPDNPAVQRFWRQLEQRVAEVPEVAAAGLALNLPPHDPLDENNFDLLDQPVPPGVSEHIAPWSTVTTGLFSTLGIPLLEGRVFTEGDSGSAPPVVVVSQAWARRYYGEGTAVGKQMISGGCTTCPPTTVIGVVGEVKYLGLASHGEAVYDPLAQSQNRSLSLIVRTGEAVGTAVRRVREVVAGLDPELPVEEVTLEARLGESLAAPRRLTGVLAGFATAAVLLAGLGVFGLMSYSVRQRRREIGLRMALGAAPGSVVGMVIRRGVGYALVGSVAGVALSVLTGRWIAAFLFGVAPAEPLTVGAVAALLVVIAGLACWLPGRAAARIAPLEAIVVE
jgi:predicted permease